MTPAEIIQLIEAAKANGLSRLKAGDVELDFSKDMVVSHVPALAQSNTATLVDLDPEIKHKVEQLKSVMQLDDQELLERMFPLPEPEDAA